MSEWMKISLGNLISIKGGFSYKGKYIGTGSSYLLGMGCVSFSEKFLHSGARPYSGDCAEIYYVKPGDLVLATRQQSDNLPILGLPAIVPEDFKEKRVIAGTNLYMVKNNSEVDNKFLYWLLKDSSYSNHILACSKGTTVRMITKDAVESFEFSCPPKTERDNISDTLWSIENKIDLLQRQNKTLEQLSETLFRQWFVVEADESWEISTFEKHIDVFRGLSYKGSGLTEKDLGLPMHNLNSVFEGGGYKYEGIKFYKGDYKERHLVNAGDIIVTNTEQGHEFRLIGFPAIVPDCFGNNGLFSQHIYKLAPLKHTYLSREFIYYLLMSPSVREQIIGATNGSTVNMLAIDGLQRPAFKMPPKEKVKQFTTIVKDCWIKKNVNQNQITTLTQLRDALLPKLMSGEVRVAN
jgi:type I restriction enzyme S subunit